MGVDGKGCGAEVNIWGGGSGKKDGVIGTPIYEGGDPI